MFSPPLAESRWHWVAAQKPVWARNMKEFTVHGAWEFSSLKAILPWLVCIVAV
jgi:hypothetical protein